MQLVNYYAVLAFPLALMACGKSATQDTPLPSTKERLAAPANITYGQKLFRACAVCHGRNKGEKHRIGPTLWNTYNAPAASLPGFKYSKALERSGLVWDDTTLDLWLENSQNLVSGNRMSYAGEPDLANRRDLIAYLKTLQDTKEE